MSVRRTVPEVERIVAGWGHPRAGEWLRARFAEGRLDGEGGLDLDRVRRELVRDEIDKLHNQAWCALERLSEGGDESGLMLIAIDELPSAVEQAASLDPEHARELLDLLARERPERHANLVRELGLWTERETAERIECLAFWEENAADASLLRRTLFRLVREELAAGRA